MQNKILTIIFIILLFIIGAYLTIKATYNNSWDGWGFGSAQTMTSIKHWVKDGWTKHYFLFIPAGYSKLTPYFDDQKLNQHARVDVTGSADQKRVYYTHFPPGYLFPLAFLMELGIENRFWFRLSQIFISLVGLWLLYNFFNLIANPTIAFAGSLFYALSVPFLNFADSLANMPIDELLRNAILILSLLAINQYNNYKIYKNYNYYIWIIYFILSISSYDSTFFVFIWLIGLDIINKQYKWKKWLIFASAPILAFLFQVAQNSFYLGFSGMLADFSNAFNKIGLSAGAGYGFIDAHFLQGVLFPITEAFAFPFRARYLIIFIAVIIALLFFIIKNKKINELIILPTNYLLLLVAAGFTQTFIVLDNHPYKGRILGLFTALLFGILIFLIIRMIQSRHSGTKSVPKLFILPLIALALFITFLQIQRTIAYAKQWPNNIYNSETIKFAEELKSVIQPLKLQNPIIFSMLPPKNNETVYYDMYYYDMPILYFNNAVDLEQDFARLKQISQYPFTAVVVAEESRQIDLIKTPARQFIIQNKKVLLIDNQ